jgi:hypothetical protein
LKNGKAALPAVVMMLLFLSACPLSTASPEATVFVDPAEVNVEVGQTFSVNISITDVSGLLGFDFLLAYDSSALELVSTGEGSFLKSVGSTFMLNLTSNGLIWLAVVVYNSHGEIVSANGAGVLAVATFKAIAEGESTLNLYSKDPYKPCEVKLAADPPGMVVPIPNVAIDGHVAIMPDPPQTPVEPPEDPPPTIASDPPPEDPLTLPSTNPMVDVNDDGVVDMKDIGYVARLFQIGLTERSWDTKADINDDGKIDMKDVGAVARDFGKTV